MQVIYRPNDRHRCYSKDESERLDALIEESPIGSVIICEECGVAKVVTTNFPYGMGKGLRDLERWPYDRKQRAEVRAYRKANNL